VGQVRRNAVSRRPAVNAPAQSAAKTAQLSAMRIVAVLG
jgi:hypothetical protein